MQCLRPLAARGGAIKSRRDDGGQEACEGGAMTRACNGEGWEEGGGTRGEGGGMIGRKTKIRRGGKNDENEEHKGIHPKLRSFSTLVQTVTR